MKARHLVAASSLMLAMAACSTTPASGPAADQSSAPPSHATPVATGWPLTLDMDLSQPVHQSIDVTCPHWAGPPSLIGAIPKSARAVAVVTVVQQEPARWNTIDGHRPSQAEALAALRASNGQISPMLWTGWLLSVTGPVLRGSVPTTITAYLRGGKLGQDDLDVDSCTSTPRPGATFLATFGGEVDNQNAAALRVPKLIDLMPYDAATGMVTTRGGVVKLSASLPTVGP